MAVKRAKRDYQMENKQLLAANVKLQDEAKYWEDKFKALVREQKKEARKRSRSKSAQKNQNS